MRISVLIPAFRPTYLAQAIASVLTQGFEDYELVISDDSGADAVAAVVGRFGDPRIRYLRTAGRTGYAANASALWREARGAWLKYLFDDDLLLPNGLADLVAALEQHPDGAFAFGHRDVVDAAGRVTGEPRMIAQGRIGPVFQPVLGRHLLSCAANTIGELSNVLLNREAGLELADLVAYRGFPIVMLTDMAVYLNGGHKGPAIGVGRTVAHFRRHAEQLSASDFSPDFPKSLCEWELFLRGEFSAEVLDPESALKGAAQIHRGYETWEARFPELSWLRAESPGLMDRIRAGDRDLLDDRFRAVWARVEAAIEGRRRQAVEAAA
jgi:glycosyltransferase involved in cell wall biosynthesis